MIKISIEKAIPAIQYKQPLRVNLEIRSGEFVVIYGKSGVGKTSLLRMIAGLLKPDQGIIEVNQQFWFNHSSKVNVPIQKRHLGFVFQDLALFPNMTVMENLLYAANNPKDRNYLQRLLTITDMQALSNRKPASLSGGQQQRLAIIRALASKPSLLLLDEPFSSLDYPLAQQLRTELKVLQAELKFTTLLVSHDPNDIYGEADQLVEIKNGNAYQLRGTPQDPNQPKNKLIGKIIQVYPFQSAFLIEITVNQEILKIPTDPQTAQHYHPDQQILITIIDGQIILS